MKYTLQRIGYLFAALITFYLIYFICVPATITINESIVNPNEFDPAPWHLNIFMLILVIIVDVIFIGMGIYLLLCLIGKQYII